MPPFGFWSHHWLIFLKMLCSSCNMLLCYSSFLKTNINRKLLTATFINLLLTICNKAWPWHLKLAWLSSNKWKKIFKKSQLSKIKTTNRNSFTKKCELEKTSSKQNLGSAEPSDITRSDRPIHCFIRVVKKTKNNEIP